jgi:hypothetical protein
MTIGVLRISRDGVTTTKPHFHPKISGISPLATNVWVGLGLFTNETADGLGQI